mgnify:CR=1 FL=1
MPTTSPKRVNRALILAEHLGQEYPDFKDNEYQPVRAALRVPVFTLGDYWCVTKPGEKLPRPDRWGWVAVPDDSYPLNLPEYVGRGIKIWRAPVTSKNE